MKLPYFRWFPADAEVDEFYSSLTDQELGFYHRCLNRAWMNDGLPMDLGDLSRVMRVTRSYLAKVWPKISQRFELVGDRFVNPRQEKEREWAISKSEKSSAASAFGQSSGGGFIYLAQRPEGTVKIGSSANVPRRLAQLRYKLRSPLTLLHQIPVPNMSAAEIALHEKYQDKRVSGEWFSLSVADLKEICITLGGDSEGDTGGDIGGDNAIHPKRHARARAESVSVSDSGVEVNLEKAEVIADLPPKNLRSFPNYRLDEQFMAFMAEVEAAGYPLIEADYLDAHSEWKAMPTEDKLLAILRFREKREGGGFPDPTKIMRPDRWLKRCEFHRKFTKSRDPTGKDFMSDVKNVFQSRIEKGESPW